MNSFHNLLLLAAAFSTAQCVSKRSLYQFQQMILCVDPESNPIMDYTNYGCYCGTGGSGTAVDDLDRCCLVHDKCYEMAWHHPECNIFDIPYFELYDYNCDENNLTITCTDRNDECEMFICECDRKAAECFATAPYIPEHQNMSGELCPKVHHQPDESSEQ